MSSFKLRRLATILAVTTLTLSLLAALTGTLLAFYYGPSAGGAHDSITQIVKEVPSGWLIQSLHNIAGNGLIAVSLVQIVVMFLGRKFRFAWLTAWVSGILLSLSAIALGWTAMSLDWTQLGYWRLSLELGTIKAIPLIGRQLQEILTGGGAIGTITLKHMYALHSYIFSIGAILLSILHLLGLLVQERQKQVEVLVVQSRTVEPPQPGQATPDKQEFGQPKPFGIA